VVPSWSRRLLRSVRHPLALDLDGRFGNLHQALRVVTLRRPDLAASRSHTKHSEWMVGEWPGWRGGSTLNWARGIAASKWRQVFVSVIGSSPFVD
jgi:hypothetical protein